MRSDQVGLRMKRIREQLRRIELGTKRLSNSAMHGGVQSHFRGQGMDFDEVREYVPGDDVRAIDWNATARAGRTFVKKYREERQLTVLFVVDMSASGTLGAGELSKRDQAVEITGVLALSAQGHDHRVGMALFSDSLEFYVPPARGRSHALRMVHDLVAFEPQGRGTELASTLRTVRERLRKRAVIVVVSDFLIREAQSAETLEELRRLAQHHDVVTIQISDANDREITFAGLLTLEDAETGEVVEVDLGSAKQRASLAHSISETYERGRTLRRNAGLDALEIDTQAQHLGELFGFFKSRGIRT